MENNRIGINVLSLFDGMSCGQIALERVGIKVNNYYASEIDKYAIEVTQHNYPNTIQIGDITKVSYEDGVLHTENGKFKGKIDLCIGGSPCQGFSFAGKQLNFDDPRSKLFFEFVRLLEETKPKYFLLENVKMKKEYQDVITQYLGVEPILINSSLVSAASRPRLYWTNLKVDTNIMDKGLTIQNTIKPIFTKDYPNWLNLKFGDNRRIDLVKDYRGKAECLSATMWKGQTRSFCKNEFNEVYKYTPEDCEIFQTVPIGYTSVVSNTQRYKMLGNGWTVDVIAHIFKNIK